MTASDRTSPEIRVLVADDSAVMRTALSNLLQASPMVRVCGTAKDGIETVEKTKLLRPDVVTLDVQMPRMDGIEALKRIMGECPCPVIMVSRLTEEGAETTIEALSAGAFDYLPKEDLQDSNDLARLQDILLAKVEAAAHSNLAANRDALSPTPAMVTRREKTVVPKIAVIGTSTGGPKALQDILPQLPEKLPIPVIIVQHMPRGFTRPLAKRLDGLSQISVCEAEEGDQLDPGKAYIAPAGQHTVLIGSSREAWITLSDTPTDTMHKPSVDVTMCSVARVFGRNVLGIILTGMGADGVKGMKAIHEAGGITVGQDEATCAVYGMPRSCALSGVLQRVVPLSEVPHVLVDSLRARH